MATDNKFEKIEKFKNIHPKYVQINTKKKCDIDHIVSLLEVFDNPSIYQFIEIQIEV